MSKSIPEGNTGPLEELGQSSSEAAGGGEAEGFVAMMAVSERPGTEGGTPGEDSD